LVEFWRGLVEASMEEACKEAHMELAVSLDDGRMPSFLEDC